MPIEVLVHLLINIKNECSQLDTNKLPEYHLFNYWYEEILLTIVEPFNKTYQCMYIQI